MKKLVLLLALSAAILTAVSCGDDKDDGRNELRLDRDALNYSRLAYTYSVGISGGSGDYSADIDDKAIADVGIAPNDNGGSRLVVTTKKEGRTTVTVKDNNSGMSVTCLLTVDRTGPEINIVSVRCGVDAESMSEEIEADVLANAPFPAGSTYLLILDTNSNEGEWVVKGPGPDNVELAGGTFTMTKMEKFNPVYNVIPINNQIYGAFDLKLTDGEKVLDYGMFVVRGTATRYMAPGRYIRICEDLTGQYQVKYPDAGVRAVARVQMCGY